MFCKACIYTFKTYVLPTIDSREAIKLLIAILKLLAQRTDNDVDDTLVQAFEQLLV